MKIEVWPNGLGCDVIAGRLRFECWDHGGVSKLRKDNSLTGSCRTHWARIAFDRPQDRKLTLPEWENLGQQTVLLWNLHPEQWKECE